MDSWRFLDYCSDGRNHIHDWYVVQDVRVRAAFDAALLALAAREDWEDPKFEQFKVLTGPHSGLSELRLNLELFNPKLRKFQKRRFRPAGIWNKEDRVFIFLVGCEKSGRMYIPANAFDMALKRKADLEAGIGALCDHV